MVFVVQYAEIRGALLAVNVMLTASHWEGNVGGLGRGECLASPQRAEAK